MIALLTALLLAQTAAPPPSVAEPTPEEVTVVAQRLKRFRAIMRKDKKTGVTQCVIKRQSGDPALDKGICDAMLACAPKIAKESDIRPCMAPAISALLPKAKWVGRRKRGL
ncbi:hypothetical protein ACFSC3_15615 [Sphingomonas floccifaciens]|uniref:UrcA family protein n=1 Tax=Sphingomonas floccifaciens TaxID=1844115 RepID=A0ABW4NGU4_9SPHN